METGSRSILSLLKIHVTIGILIGVTSLYHWWVSAVLISIIIFKELIYDSAANAGTWRLWKVSPGKSVYRDVDENVLQFKHKGFCLDLPTYLVGWLFSTWILTAFHLVNKFS